MPASPFIRALPATRRAEPRQAIMTTGKDGAIIAVREVDQSEVADTPQEQLKAANARKWVGQSVALVAITVLERAE